ncbi:MAG: serine hydrolase domain-containing protein [Gemmatimonadota bacterium]
MRVALRCAPLRIAPLRFAPLRCAALLGLLVACAPRARGVASTGAGPAAAVDSALTRRLSTLADSVRAAQRWPGLSIAVVRADGATSAVTSGLADTARKIPLRPTDKLLQGSVGKTYVAAIAMQLVAEGKLDIDAPIARYLTGAPLLDSIVGARRMTVRHLMTHSSGIVRYEFDPVVTARLRAEPFKTWTPEERLMVLFGKTPPFAPGEGWEYSDTNYIVLGMIIERVTGHPYYAELRRRLLEPLRLTATIPSDRRELPGVANGYAGPKNDLGGYDASIGADGRFAMNPQFEWTGGGVASTTLDLARWAKLMYEGHAFPDSLLPRMTTGVPSRLGGGARYGLGVILRDTPLGASWGHSGFFPGYATEMVYFPASRVAVAVQVNITDPYPRGLVPLLQRIAREAGARDTVAR